jgi:hypothetical protein
MKRLVLLMLFATSFAVPALAQECLHGPNEAASERDRREYAMRLARQINEAQAVWIAKQPPTAGYASPSQLKLPEMPLGFGMMFHLNGRRYTFSIKDDRDPCFFAIFSDNSGLVYAAMPESAYTLQQIAPAMPSGR